MSRVIDCFMAHTELELIALRIHTLRDVVNQFVCVEGTTTHSGLPRGLIYPAIRAAFPDIPLICHVTELPSPSPDRWLPERMQRNAMLPALSGVAASDDLVMMSDADEIPDPNHVRHIGTHWQACYLYYLNAYFHSEWPGTVTVPYAELQFTTPAGWRAQNGRLPRIHGGWHFSYQGGVATMQQKLRSFGHAEYDIPVVHAGLVAQRARLQDPFGRDGNQSQGRIVPIDERFPRYLREHPERFPGMIAALP